MTGAYGEGVFGAWPVHESRWPGLWVEQPGDEGSAVVFCAYCPMPHGWTEPTQAEAQAAAARHADTLTLAAAVDPAYAVAQTMIVRAMPKGAHRPASPSRYRGGVIEAVTHGVDVRPSEDELEARRFDRDYRKAAREAARARRAPEYEARDHARRAVTKAAEIARKREQREAAREARKVEREELRQARVAQRQADRNASRKARVVTPRPKPAPKPPKPRATPKAAGQAKAEYRARLVTNARPEDVAEVQRRIDAGQRLPDIATETGISREALSAWSKADLIQTRTGPRPGDLRKREQMGQARDLHMQGWGVVEIARRVGVSRATVRVWRDAGHLGKEAA